jgi:ABC-type transport system involved in multi-copper enzyme maturation permease subunit
MIQGFAASAAWLRRYSRQDYLHCLALATVTGVAIWLAVIGSGGLRLAIGAGFLLTLAVLLRRGWVKLSGPVALHELVRSTRRSRFILYRLYAYFVLIVLALCYCVWVVSRADAHAGTTVPARELARFAASFVVTFLGLQMLLMAVLTPAYAAGVIAEEKDRGTLEFLLATDLRNSEIVLSKLAARLANLLLTLLTGLPILCFLQFLGGVEPLVVFAGFAATAFMMVGLAGLSVLNSVYCRRSHLAIILTLLQVAAYLVICLIVSRLVIGTGIGVRPIPGLGGLSLSSAFAWLDAGNPLSLLLDLASDAMSGLPIGMSFAMRLGGYALFHSFLALICVSWASVRLREVFRKQVYERDPSSRHGERIKRSRHVGRWPMIWKELVAERGLRFRWFGRAVIAVLVLGSFLPVVMWGTVPSIRNFFALYSRGMGAAVGCVLLLSVALRAATTITGERERQTLDGLLMTPQSAGEILLGKWLGSVASVRWGWLWLGAIWGLGVVSRELPLGSLVLLVAAWWVYASVLAVVGLWFSLVLESSLRATVLTLLLAFGLGASYFVTLPVVMMLPNWQNPGTFITYLNRFQLGMSPIITLSWLLAPESTGWELPTALAGLLCWAVAGIVLWSMLLRRFRKSTRRELEREPGQDSGMKAVLAASTLRILVVVLLFVAFEFY